MALHQRSDLIQCADQRQPADPGVDIDGNGRRGVERAGDEMAVGIFFELLRRRQLENDAHDSAVRAPGGMVDTRRDQDDLAPFYRVVLHADPKLILAIRDVKKLKGRMLVAVVRMKRRICPHQLRRDRQKQAIHVAQGEMQGIRVLHVFHIPFRLVSV